MFLEGKKQPALFYRATEMTGPKGPGPGRHRTYILLLTLIKYFEKLKTEVNTSLRRQIE